MRFSSAITLYTNLIKEAIDVSFDVTKQHPIKKKSLENTKKLNLRLFIFNKQ